MIKIALIPIDNRPICYDLIKDILSVDSDIELFMPEISHLGGLIKTSNTAKLFDFIENLPEIDYFIVSLDTIAYGGLISSRRCDDGFDKIKKRIVKFKQITEKKVKKILAFSSIMRISNNNINEEEKEYWAQWGKRIFDWSYYLHKSEVEKSYNCVHNTIPEKILEDYLETRKRNYDINKIYLEWAKEGFFDTLIFSKDDCAQYGLNVKEAQKLENIIKTENIDNALIKTGADEIPLSLISRALTKENTIKIKPEFIEDASKNLISKYEDISIEKCTLGQINLAGIEISTENPDIIMLVNNFKTEQGDLVLGDIINSIQKEIKFPKIPYCIADVNNANGSDKNLIEQLFKYGINNLYGYCGYNTSANTIGCTILEAIVKFFALQKGTYNKNAFKKLHLIRFLDDWAYQAISRKYVRESKFNFRRALEEKYEELNNNALIIEKFLNYDPKKIEYSLPWDRSFEIRINIEE